MNYGKHVFWLCLSMNPFNFLASIKNYIRDSFLSPSRWTVEPAASLWDICAPFGRPPRRICQFWCHSQQRAPQEEEEEHKSRDAHRWRWRHHFMGSKQWPWEMGFLQTDCLWAWFPLQSHPQLWPYFTHLFCWVLEWIWHWCHPWTFKRLPLCGSLRQRSTSAVQSCFE